MPETVYLKTTISSKVHKTNVSIGDIAKVYCENTSVANKVKALHAYTFHNSQQKRIVFSALKLIEIICEAYPTVDVSHIGEIDFVIEYESNDKKFRVPTWINVLLCCIIIFFGAAFTIMTFNTDVSVSKMFSQIYTDVTGRTHDGFTILEITYSIGIGIGIIVFYNHFGKKKLSYDPTPIEMEMRKYETEIDTYYVDGVSKKGDHIDVS